MKFKAKKVYGRSKQINCPFCDKLATQKNEAGVDVCRFHTKSVLQEVKCTCGSWLEPRVGKFGTYFNCINCGNLNMAKVNEIKAMTMKDQPQEVIIDTPKPSFSRSIFSENKKRRKEITITSHDVEYFD